MATLHSRLLYLVPLGGLGNQLFQAAFAESIAKTYAGWSSEFLVASTTTPVSTFSKVARRPTIQRNLVRLLARHGSSSVPIDLSDNQFVGFWKISRKLSIGTGYFQTQTAADFELLPFLDQWHCVAECKCTLCHNEGRDASLSHTSPAAENVTSVHIRLGDYLFGKNPWIQGVSDPLQQLAVAAAVKSIARDENPLNVFTDSPEIVKEIRQRPNLRDIEIKIADSPCAACVLLNMASSRRLIISNSTLSWWAGVLSAKFGGEVHQPTPWMYEPSDTDHELRIPGAQTFRRRVLDSESVENLKALLR